jgi:polyhydroxyalkanoate synthesis regulator protein
MMPDEFIRKNIEMWENFTSTYMDTMFKTVERAMQQSQVFRESVDSSVNKAMANQTEATMATLKAMQRQLEALTEKVDQLMEKEEK